MRRTAANLCRGFEGSFVKERRRYLLILGAILALLVGAALLAVPGSPAYKKPTLGLDLRGGLEVVLKAQPKPGQSVTPQNMTTAQNVMVRRVNQIGVSSPNVATQGTDEIVIQLAGIHDPAKAAAIIGSTGQLQFYDFEKDLAAPTVNQLTPTPYPTAYSLLKQIEGQVKKAGVPSSYYLFGPKTVTKTVNGKTTKTTTKHAILQTALTRNQLLGPYNGKKPAGTEILAVPGNRQLVHGPLSTQATRAIKQSPNNVYWYLFKYAPKSANGPPEITGKELKESAIQADIGQDGQPEVQLGFKGDGGNQFKKITKDEYDRGLQQAGFNGSSGTLNQLYAQHNAIVLDGKLQATPFIDYTSSQLQDGIVGGAVISDMGTTKAAQDLALVLQSGSLPYTFKQLSETTVSATLGKSSLHQAILAALAGLIIVAIFMLVLYRFLGLVAVFGLAIYALLYYAAILLFNVTLTLPGFAGLILTIGVAADANVVVFERIKEEVRAGRSVRSAISAGYGKGFHTIVDANVVTMITALVIFLVAVADVKGFALMLLIGTAISLLTAVVATRAMLGLLSGFKWFDSPRFMGAGGQQTAKWLQIDYMGKRKLWFAISGAVIVAGLISLGAQGLNLGIDFKGGVQFQFQTNKPYSQEQVQSFMTKQGEPDAVVQGQGKSVNGDFKSWQVRTKTLDRAGQNNLQQNLKNDLGASGGG